MRGNSSPGKKYVLDNVKAFVLGHSLKPFLKLLLQIYMYIYLNAIAM